MWAPWASGRGAQEGKGCGLPLQQPRPRPTPRRPATRDGAGPGARHSRHRPLSLRVRAGGRGGPGGPGEQPDPSPTRNGPSRARWGEWPRSPGRGRSRLRTEEEPPHSPRPLGQSPAPPCGRGRLPPHCVRLPASFPPPGALPRATVPTDGGVKRTYLEPDKQEPLRPGSQSPPGVTGTAPANRRCRREPRQPIPLHSGLRAPESSANEQERWAGAASGPNPLFYNLPGGGRGPLARTRGGRSLAGGRVLELRA